MHKGVAGTDFVVHQHQRPCADKLRVQQRVGRQVQKHLRRVAVAFFKRQGLRADGAVAAGVQVQRWRIGVLALPGLKHALAQAGGGLGHADEQHRPRLRAHLRRNAPRNALVAVLHHCRGDGQVLGQHAADKQKSAARVVARCQHKQFMRWQLAALDVQLQRAAGQAVGLGQRTHGNTVA